MKTTAVASRTSAALVALVAGYSSFSHIAHVALRYGERPEVAYALPFAVDGLLIVATTAMLDDKRNRRHVRWSARVAFAFGVTASLAANVASAAPTLGARIVAAVPAIALLLAVEVLSRVGRPIATADDEAAKAVGRSAWRPRWRGDAATVVERPAFEAGQAATMAVRPAAQTPLAGQWRDAVPVPPEDATPPATTATADATETPLLVAAPPPSRPASASVPPRPRAAQAGAATAARVAAILAAAPDADTATVAARLGMSVRTARRHMAVLRTADPVAV